MTNAVPQKLSSEGYLETIPDLVAEVRSKNDTMAELERKAGEYLAAENEAGVGDRPDPVGRGGLSGGPRAADARAG